MASPPSHLIRVCPFIAFCTSLFIRLTNIKINLYNSQLCRDNITLQGVLLFTTVSSDHSMVPGTEYLSNILNEKIIQFFGFLFIHNYKLRREAS